MEVPELAGALADDPGAHEFELLVLHGSRARGDAGPHSDWDVAYLSPTADPAALVTMLVRLLRTEAVDVVDLARAGALLRFRVARDGVVLLARDPDAFLRFRLEAVRFWCDAGPVIRAAQDDVLATLARDTA